MLRIDESSKTLVAPQQAQLVAEAAPERDELLALVSSGWQAFAAEIGQPHLHAVATAPKPGIDVLAFDEAAGRLAVVIVADNGRSAFGQALVAAAEVAAWDAAALADVHDALQAAVPGDSPRIVLVAGEFDAQMLATMDWLVRRHGLELTAYAVHTMRFGAERLLNVTRAYPPAAETAHAPDAAGFLAQVGSAAPPAGHSAPPPGVPAA